MYRSRLITHNPPSESLDCGGLDTPTVYKEFVDAAEPPPRGLPSSEGQLDYQRSSTRPPTKFFILSTGHSTTGLDAIADNTRDSASSYAPTAVPDTGDLPTSTCWAERVTVRQRLGGEVGRPLAERTERTLLRAVRTDSGHQQIRCLHIRQPAPLQGEHLSHQPGCAVVVTGGVTISDQLIRRTCDALTRQRRQVAIILAVSVDDRRTHQQDDTHYGDAGKHEQTVRPDPRNERGAEQPTSTSGRHGDAGGGPSNRSNAYHCDRFPD